MKTSKTSTKKSIEYAEERVKAIKTEEFFQGKKSE